VSQVIKVWLYPGANPNSNPSSWGAYETDISAYVRRPGQDGGAPISYSWGKQDESTQTDAGTMNLTLDNRDGRFSTDKIDGPYYGLIDINTPIRLGVLATSDTFTRTVSGAIGPAAGWAGSWLNTAAGSTTYSVDGSKGLINTSGANIFSVAQLGGGSARDVDMTSSVIPIVNPSGASYDAGHTVRYTDLNNFVYITLEFSLTTTVILKIWRRVGGVVSELAALNPIPSSSFTPGTPWKLRTQMEGDTVRVKAWPSAGAEPGAWMLSADETELSGTGVGTYASRFASNTNGAVNFVAFDDFIVTGLEWTGFVSAWPLRWDITGNNSWAPITAGGILRRLRQGTNPILSPLRRQLGSTPDATGYWPMEEGADAKYFLAASPNTAQAIFTDVSPGADSSLPGASVAPTLNNASSTITLTVKKGKGLTFGMAAMVFFKVGTVPATKTRIIRLRTRNSVADYWDFSIDVNNTYIEAFSSDGAPRGSSTGSVGFDMAGQWVAWQLEADTTGYSSIYHKVFPNAPFFAQTGTFLGIGWPDVNSMQLTGVSGASFSHAWIGRDTLPFVSFSFANVAAGYAGETAANRFARICTEAGIPYSVAGASAIMASTEKMGAQKESTTLIALQAAVDADYAAVVERGAGLELIPRQTRWNLAQSMALSVAAGQIAAVPQPTRDDQRLRNQWTVSRLNGASATSSNQTSVDRNGPLGDSATLNLYDDSGLENHAGWRVSVGSQPRMRWPSISIDLARNPSLVEAWRKRFYGWRIGITTGLTQVRGNEPDVIMEGYQATLTPELWNIEMNATDAKVWTAAVTDDTGILGRADNEYCTSTSAISATTLSIPITTATGFPKWDNTAGLWTAGVDFNVGGERVTVTSITNGAGQTQTLNATVRGVDGYAFAHGSGSKVSLWNPALVAL
jgi:hypothetical protein